MASSADMVAARAAIAPVLADVRSSGAPMPLLTFSDDGPGIEVRLTADDGTWHAFESSKTCTSGEAIVDVSDRVQDWVIEQLAAQARSTSWPNCPLHPHSHPLQPTELAQGPAWVCPASDVVVATIGGLAREPAAGPQ